MANPLRRETSDRLKKKNDGSLAALLFMAMTSPSIWGTVQWFLLQKLESRSTTVDYRVRREVEWWYRTGG